MDKTMLIKCVNCGERLDEATETIEYREKRPYCEYCAEEYDAGAEPPVSIVVGVCREDNPRDVDEAYGPGTYARLFPDTEEGE